MTASAEGRPGPALSRRLLLFALVNSLLVPDRAARCCRAIPAEACSAKPTRAWLELRQESDSWGPMEQAFELVERPQPAKPLYEKIFFERRVKFQYPPSSLLPFWLMSKLLPREQWPDALNAVSLLAFLAVSIAASAALLAFSLARLGGKAARTARAGRLAGAGVLPAGAGLQPRPDPGLGERASSPWPCAAGSRSGHARRAR